jgi:hypothetical protein
VEVDLDIHEKVICTKFDLASDDKRKIWESYLQIIACTGHLVHFLGIFIMCRLIGHVLQKTHVVEF